MLTIYHNPRCSKSRQTLALLEENGHKPVIIEYLSNRPSANTLKQILSKLDMSPRELLRKGEDIYKEKKLNDDTLSDNQIIEFMSQYPKLIERPIVINGNKAVIGRPPENVLTIL
ncbi:MAG: arsenate reductase (glutaredoxin) [Cellvibrionaceae bacterium]